MVGAGDFSGGGDHCCECCSGDADVGAGDADTAAGEDDGLLDWSGIGSWIDSGIEIDIGVGNWRSIGGGIDTGVNAGVRIWRSSSFVIDIGVSIGRDAGVGAAGGCDECCAGRCVWRGVSGGCGAERWRRN